MDDLAQKVFDAIDRNPVLTTLPGESDGTIARLAEMMDLMALIEGTVGSASPAGQLLLNRIDEARRWIRQAQ